MIKRVLQYGLGHVQVHIPCAGVVRVALALLAGVAAELFDHPQHADEVLVTARHLPLHGLHLVAQLTQPRVLLVPVVDHGLVLDALGTLSPAEGGDGLTGGGLEVVDTGDHSGLTVAAQTVLEEAGELGVAVGGDRALSQTEDAVGETGEGQVDGQRLPTLLVLGRRGQPLTAGQVDQVDLGRNEQRRVRRVRVVLLPHPASPSTASVLCASDCCGCFVPSPPHCAARCPP